MHDRDDPPKAGEKPEALLQDYLDGLLGLGSFESPVINQSQEAVADTVVDKAAAIPREIRYQADRVAGDRASDAMVRPAAVPNNVLPLPRFAEARPLALTLPLPKLKPVAPVAEVSVKTETVKVETKIETPVDVAPTIVAEIPVVQPVEIAPPVIELEPVAEALDELLDAVDQAVEDAVAQNAGFQPREWLANGRPDWAQGRFECLMFSVGGLSLAVPLVELGNISPLNDELTPLFGQIDWFMGLLLTRTGKLRTVDTAKIVMPERYHSGLRENYRFVLSIADMDWGLAVDDVSTAISLTPEDVKWRSQRSKRPWLAGTLVSQMCAVLDIQQLALLLFQAEQPSR